MAAYGRSFFAAGILMLSVNLGAQASSLTPTQVAPFLGTWVVAMSNPAGAQETVKITNTNGTITASVQLGKFPPSEVTGMLKDGEMLVLTTTRRENGEPIRVVMMLTLEGQTMNLAQLL